MKRHEKQMVEQILNLWLSYREKIDYEQAITGMGPTIAGNLVDFRGELPESSAYKPEVISAKADMLRCVTITTDERTANQALMSLPPKERMLVTCWPQLRNRYNPATGETWRQVDVARAFAESFDVYTKALELVHARLLVAWRKLGGRETA